MYTVEEVTLYIKNKLCSDTNLMGIWVSGEISNFVHHTSGHFYFTLKDESSQLPCAMFKWANQDLKFRLADGLKIIAKGEIDVYTPQGRYNFVVSTVQPKGIGELYLKYLQLKERLAKEGLFDVTHKKPIPRFPRRIGVITSPTGAAVKDILNIAKRRFPAAEMLIVPTLVQGDRAAEDISRKISLVNRFGGVDVAIVGRGGGSIEDLWPFNEEVVARAIFDSQVPIVSAVGHETDFTISDFVADLRAPTPSAAAELVVPDRNDIAREIAAFYAAMSMSMRGILELKSTQVAQMRAQLRPAVITDRIVHNQQSADHLTTRMLTFMRHRLETARDRYEALCGMLDAVSPLATLNRGYSITLKLPGEEVIDTVSRTKKGDEVKVLVRDGEMKCKIHDVVKKRHFGDEKELKGKTGADKT
ncbi:MAG: exodeoxyribonuclease VII large subunit [Thermoplasmata archaeon]|nr:MAG: exodeoxyribonuclease VII large subunit [Thermoplasmata archaeon]